LALITSTLWNVNVWCGIIENRAIILGGNLNGQKYANFLRDKLQILLDKVPLSHCITMWLQQDSCPVHNCTYRNVLNRMFPDMRGGRIYWPTWSPDFTLLNFFL